MGSLACDFLGSDVTSDPGLGSDVTSDPKQEGKVSPAMALLCWRKTGEKILPILGPGFHSAASLLRLEL